MCYKTLKGEYMKALPIYEESTYKILTSIAPRVITLKKKRQFSYDEFLNKMTSIGENAFRDAFKNSYDENDKNGEENNAYLGDLM